MGGTMGSPLLKLSSELEEDDDEDEDEGEDEEAEQDGLVGS